MMCELSFWDRLAQSSLAVLFFCDQIYYPGASGPIGPWHLLAFLSSLSPPQNPTPTDSLRLSGVLPS